MHDTLDPARRARLDSQLALVERARALVPAQRAPYFAHLKLRHADGKESDVLLGLGLRAAPGLALVDWRTAPLARILFACDEGDEYEVELSDRRLEGVLLEKNLVTFRSGELSALRCSLGTIARDAGGNWQATGSTGWPVLSPRSAEERAKVRSPVDVPLDAAQREVVELPPGEATLILGEAGCGKTTVALHRLRRLSETEQGSFRAAVIVPTEGLRRLCEALLVRLKLPMVEAWTFDQFASKQARAALPGLPKRESQWAPAGVSRLKRHAAVREAIELLARQEPARRDEDRVRISRELKARAKSGAVVESTLRKEGDEVDADDRAELHELLESHGVGEVPAGEQGIENEAAQQADFTFHTEKERRREGAMRGRNQGKLARREDLQALFGDRTLLEKIVGAAPHELQNNLIGEAFEHTRRQFSETAEEKFAHVDEEQKRTADGRGLDEGTPAEDAGSIDVEDYAVLLALEKRRAEVRRVRPAQLRTYDCLVLDEAQELAPLELELVGRSVSRSGTLIVAGDAAQQVDESSHFKGWPAAMNELRARKHRSVVLQISYRCPPEVTAFARSLRDDREEPLVASTPSQLALGAAPSDRRALVLAAGGDALAGARFDEECHLLAWLSQALRELDRFDAGAAVAVICRTSDGARRLWQMLEPALPIRLALEGKFRFGPGMQLTSVPEVKGLEVDHVVLPDASAQRYPDSDESRRALYVAATRASAQLLLACAATESPLWPRTIG